MRKERNERGEEKNEKLNVKRRNKPGDEPGDANRNKCQNLKMRATTQNITVGSVVSHMGTMGIVMAGTMLSALVFRKGAYQKTSTVINV